MSLGPSQAPGSFQDPPLKRALGGWFGVEGGFLSKCSFDWVGLEFKEGCGVWAGCWFLCVLPPSSGRLLLHKGVLEVLGNLHNYLQRARVVFRV